MYYPNGWHMLHLQFFWQNVLNPRLTYIKHGSQFSYCQRPIFHYGGLIVFTTISILDIFGQSLLGNAATEALSAAKNAYQQNIVAWLRTLSSSMFMSVVTSILTRNRIEPQHVDLISFPLTTSRKFKFERVTSDSFHTNCYHLQTTNDNHVKLVTLV